MEKQKTSIDFLEMFFSRDLPRERTRRGHRRAGRQGPGPAALRPISGHARARPSCCGQWRRSEFVRPREDRLRFTSPAGVTVITRSEALLEACEKRRRGVDRRRRGRQGRTPLHLAVCRGRKKVASGLLKWERRPEQASTHELGETALHVVCADYLETTWRTCCYDILESGRCRINAVDSLARRRCTWRLAGGRQNKHRSRAAGRRPGTGIGKTPLHWAVYLGHQNSVHELLVNGADPNLADHQGDDSSALAVPAAERRRLCAAVLRVVRRARSGASLGTSTTSWAILRCTTPWPNSCQKHLTPTAAGVGSRSKSGQQRGIDASAQHLQREQYYDDCLARLFQSTSTTKSCGSCRIDARDNLGPNALELAVAKSFAARGQVLLSHGADFSSFVFPTEAYIAKFDRSLGLRYNLTTIKSLRAIDHLARWKNYTLDVSDVPENHGSVRRARTARGVGHARTRLGRERGLRERSDGHHDKFGPVAPRSDPAGREKELSMSRTEKYLLLSRSPAVKPI
ncbi:unnamed protein product [Trichogramma brassicae]|uniref:Uncharacterized protein n=1 Tax=Trichogramma brassicae TaxID=86971 RepID=A0A6H5ICM3_9HYME|nr:unnamed protein product [Trichogramma brassicae]